jgi:hypothetical protein
VSDGTQGSLSPLQLIHCVNQLSVTVFKKKKTEKTTYKEKGLFWLTVSEVSVYDQLAHCFGSEEAHCGRSS